MARREAEEFGDLSAIENLMPLLEGELVIRRCGRVDRRGYQKVETIWFQALFSRGQREHLGTGATVSEAIKNAFAAAG